jgi:hypothetical protein
VTVVALFSSEHGLFSSIPLVLLATVGLVLFKWSESHVGTLPLAAALALCIFIACYPDWAGISSLGNHFIVSLTSLFIIGLSVSLGRTATLVRNWR